MNPAHNFPVLIPTIRPNINFSSIPSLSEYCLPFRFHNQNIVCISHLYMRATCLRPSHLPWFDHPDIWWNVQVMELLINILHYFKYYRFIIHFYLKFLCFVSNRVPFRKLICELCACPPLVSCLVKLRTSVLNTSSDRFLRNLVWMGIMQLKTFHSYLLFECVRTCATLEPLKFWP